MVARIRVGAVEYLNTKPLIEGLQALAPEADLILDLPSRLADRLAAEDIDVALIPVVEFFRGAGYSLIPGLAIASRGPVLSVTVFSRVPWPEIRTLALDVGSRTSAALTEVLLRKRYGHCPRFQSLAMDADVTRLSCDAVLLIGDRAMRADLPGYRFAFDLGEEWYEWTGLPFVYAVWAVRPGVNLGPVAEALIAAKRRGVANVAAVAAREAAALDLDPAFCRRYLTNIIRFDLGPPEWAGLKRFYSLTSELGLAPAGVPLELYFPSGPARAGERPA